jgi:hypothetical protein
MLLNNSIELSILFRLIVLWACYTILRNCAYCWGPNELATTRELHNLGRTAPKHLLFYSAFKGCNLLLALFYNTQQYLSTLFKPSIRISMEMGMMMRNSLGNSLRNHLRLFKLLELTRICRSLARAVDWEIGRHHISCLLCWAQSHALSMLARNWKKPIYLNLFRCVEWDREFIVFKLSVLIEMKVLWVLCTKLFGIACQIGAKYDSLVLLSQWIFNAKEIACRTNAQVCVCASNPLNALNNDWCLGNLFSCWPQFW